VNDKEIGIMTRTVIRFINHKSNEVASIVKAFCIFLFRVEINVVWFGIWRGRVLGVTKTRVCYCLVSCVAGDTTMFIAKLCVI